MKMKEKLKKLQIKGFVAGMLVMFLLFSVTMIAANPQTVTRQITYGINVNLNGQNLQFDATSRPFTMGGTTFMPLRAISEALDIPVDFDPATNTVFLGNRFAGQRVPLQQAAPFFDRTPSASGNIDRVVARNSVTMAGVTYNNVLTFNNVVNRRAFSLHNLGGQYRMLTGHIGRVDGTGRTNATVNFYGDGTLLQSFDLAATDMPTPISIFVEGVHQLRVDVNYAGRVVGVFSINHSLVTQYALSAFLE